MRKFFLLLFLLLALPQISFAADASARVSKCFDTFKRCNQVNGTGEDKGNRNVACDPIGNDTVHKSSAWWHRIQLNLEPFTFPPNSNFLIVECTDVKANLDDDPEEEFICTTGNSTEDKKLFCGDPNATAPGCDGLEMLKKSKNKYTISGGSKGIYHFINDKYERATNLNIPTDATGKSTVKRIEWERESATEIDLRITSKFYVTYTVEPTPTPTTPAAAPITTVSPGAGGQQQAILTFPTSSTTPNEGCYSLKWDPYGRVFDAVSLEPIPNTEVTLEMKNAGGLFTSSEAKSKNEFIKNPFPGGIAGEFFFFVVDGEYKLSPRVLTGGYTHPSISSNSQLSSNVSNVYSDLYFNDSPPIVQLGSIQHRDIPLMPEGGVGRTYDPVLLYESEPELLSDSTIIYKGKVSHPYAEVVVETCKQENGTEVCNNPQIYNHKNGGPNNVGEYAIILDQKLLQPGEYYSRTIRKVDLTTFELVKKSPIDFVIGLIKDYIFPQEIYAQENEISKSVIDPIPTYIEGFAYDSTGKIMPNATVNIISFMSRVPAYQIQADERGYYKITSEFLPAEEYKIEYVNAETGVKSSLSTSQVLGQNEEFILSERINPYLVTTAETDPRKNIVPSFTPPQVVAQVSDSTPPNVTEPTTNPESQSSNNSFLLIGAILLLLVATAGTLIGVYLYRKKMQENTEL